MNLIPIAEIHRQVNNQDMPNDRRHRQIIATTESHLEQCRFYIYTSRPTSIIGPSSRTRSSSDWWQRTSDTSRLKKRCQEETTRSNASSNISGTTSIPRITRWQRRETETAEYNRRSKKEERRQVRWIKRPFRERLPQGNCCPLSLLIAVHHHGSRKSNREYHPRQQQPMSWPTIGLWRKDCATNSGLTCRRMPKKQDAKWKVYTATIEDGTFTWQPWTP